jgi:hypothetical protein
MSGAFSGHLVPRQEQNINGAESTCDPAARFANVVGGIGSVAQRSDEVAWLFRAAAAF